MFAKFFSNNSIVLKSSNKYMKSLKKKIVLVSRRCSIKMHLLTTKDGSLSVCRIWSNLNKTEKSSWNGRWRRQSYSKKLQLLTSNQWNERTIKSNEKVLQNERDGLEKARTEKHLIFDYSKLWNWTNRISTKKQNHLCSRSNLKKTSDIALQSCRFQSKYCRTIENLGPYRNKLDICMHPIIARAILFALLKQNKIIY